MPVARPTLTAGYPVGVGIDGSSPRETFAPDQTVVTARWKVLAGERYQAVPWFLGYARLARSGGPGTSVVRLERLTPKPHFNADTGAALDGVYATAVPEVTPFKATGKSAALASAGEGSHATSFESVLAVQYEHVPFDVLEDGAVAAGEEWRRYVWLKDWTDTVEPLTLPAGTRKYVEDTGGAGTAFGAIPYGRVIQLHVFRFTLAWELLPADLYAVGTTTPTAWQKRVYGWPADSIDPLVGRVNSEDWLAYPAGTLLLENVKPIQRRHPTVGRSWTMEVTFAHNPVGWLNAYYFATASSARPSGWYFAAEHSAARPAQWYDVDDVPEDYGLFNVGEVWRVFDPTG